MWLILIPSHLLSEPRFIIVSNIYLFLDVSCTGYWLVNFNWWNCDHLGYQQKLVMCFQRNWYKLDSFIKDHSSIFTFQNLTPLLS